jgi:hypothetical protein
MFAVMKTFVTDISASTGRNEEVENVKSLWHADGQTNTGHFSIRKAQVS